MIAVKLYLFVNQLVHLKITTVLCVLLLFIFVFVFDVEKLIMLVYLGRKWREKFELRNGKLGVIRIIFLNAHPYIHNIIDI